MQFQKAKYYKPKSCCRILLISAATWVLITCTLNYAPSLTPSESHPNNLGKACDFITNPLFNNNNSNKCGPNIIFDSFGKNVAELNFKQLINWKQAVLLQWEGQDPRVAQARSAPLQTFTCSPIWNDSRW